MAVFLLSVRHERERRFWRAPAATMWLGARQLLRRAIKPWILTDFWCPPSCAVWSVHFLASRQREVSTPKMVYRGGAATIHELRRLHL
jgi:hypothetical protein